MTSNGLREIGKFEVIVTCGSFTADDRHEE
jgi:hypothetical protein